MPSIDTLNDERREWYEDREAEELASYFDPAEDGDAFVASLEDGNEVPCFDSPQASGSPC